MSVLRDAMELGYGTDHFMITGEDFPSGWEDDSDIYPDDEYSHTEHETQKEPGSLDTKEGWIKRKYIVDYNSTPIGVMNGVEYYHLDQTYQFSNIMKNTVDIIEEHLNKLSSYIVDNDGAKEKDLDSEYYYIRCAIIEQIDYSYKLMKENPSFNEYYIKERIIKNRFNVSDIPSN